MDIDLEIHPEQKAWFVTSNLQYEFEVRFNTTRTGVSPVVFFEFPDEEF